MKNADNDDKNAQCHQSFAVLAATHLSNLNVVLIAVEKLLFHSIRCTAYILIKTCGKVEERSLVYLRRQESYYFNRLDAQYFYMFQIITHGKVMLGNSNVCSNSGEFHFVPLVSISIMYYVDPYVWAIYRKILFNHYNAKATGFRTCVITFMSFKDIDICFPQITRETSSNTNTVCVNLNRRDALHLKINIAGII